MLRKIGEECENTFPNERNEGNDLDRKKTPPQAFADAHGGEKALRLG